MSQRTQVDLKALAQLDGVVLRLVEQQGVPATRRTTDSLVEQAWLEDFLEDSKPEFPSAEECPVRHRLLLTPFRYRKRHGSRFATRWERGLFYGSRSRFGCLLEGAYYELVFQNGPEHPFPRSSAMRKALFHVQVSTSRGLKLQEHGSRGLQARLRDPIESHFCQGIGRQMREAGIEAFEYHSARSVQDVVQVGAISCCVFPGTPFDQVEVQLEANGREVSIRCLDDNTVHHFRREQFEVKGELPRPSL
ncbi:MAG: RES domain-containing protein [Cyanobacteria bacterium K_Offshore_surface_m2_239]|nr:RES domain-containing protein [Cyanobacteria bacterium K_Offshore_surface_m2_239]